jgi:hypothetical protein
MYIRIMDDLKRGPDDYLSGGIVLCTHKDASVASNSVPHENERLFAGEYRLVLPFGDDLWKKVESGRDSLEEPLKQNWLGPHWHFIENPTKE